MINGLTPHPVPLLKEREYARYEEEDL